MKLIFTILYTFSFLFSFSQSIAFQNLNSIGGIISDNEYNVTFTLGQPITGTISNQNNNLTQGFQQNLSNSGCTDFDACNYNELASNDDGSCTCPDTIYSEIITCESYEWNSQTYTESGTYNYSQPLQTIENGFSLSNGFVEIPSTFSLPDDNFTISGEFKSDYIGSVPLFTQYNGLSTGGSSWNILIATTSNTLNCQINGINGQVELNASFNANDGQWHKFDVVYSHQNNIFSIYIDGQLLAFTDNTKGSLINNNFITHIGALGGYSYIGSFDNIQIWNQAFSEENILEYTNCPLNPNYEGLVGFWNFEEGLGNSAVDLSGNGNDGIIYDASYTNDVREQNCQYTEICDNLIIEVLNLTISQPDTSITNVVACESFEWNGNIYENSGIYVYNTTNENSNNNYSVNFNGGNDHINIGRPLNSLDNGDEASFSVWFKSTITSGDRVFISNDTEPTNPELNFGINDGKVYVSGGPSTQKSHLQIAIMMDYGIMRLP